MKRMMMATALLLAAQFVLLATITVRAQENDGSDAAVEDLWVDVSIGEDFVDWINTTVRENDMVRIDHLPMIALLEKVQRGKRLVVVKTIPEAEQVLLQMADQIDIIGYNLEHGPGNDPSEQAAPIESARRMRQLADEYGLQLAIGPDRSFALSDGVAMAEYADFMILQVQRVQQSPATVTDFVFPLAEAMHKANPNVQIGVQIGAQGDVEQIVALIRQLAPAVEGISILTDHDSVDFSAQLVAALRPASSALSVPTAAVESEEQSTAPVTVTLAVTPTGVPLQATPDAVTPDAMNSQPGMTAISVVYWLGFLTLIVFGVGVTITALLYVLPRSD